MLECFSRCIKPYIINWICENLLTENCSHLTGIKPECDVFWSTRLKITPQQEMKRKNRESKENGRRRREKAMVALLVFIVATLVHQFWRNHFLREFLGKASYSSALYQFCQKTVSVIEVWCTGIGYLLRCGKRELSPPLNPVAANPF